MCRTSFGCGASPVKMPTFFEYFSRTGMIALKSFAQPAARPGLKRYIRSEMREVKSNNIRFQAIGDIKGVGFRFTQHFGLAIREANTGHA